MSQAKVTPYKIDEGKKNGGGKRGECAGRSRESFWRLVEVLASHQSAFEPPGSVLFVTLTYGRDYDDWHTAKKHLEALRAYMTRHWGDRMTGIWVPEVQERGAPHFQFLLRWLGDDAELDEVAGADRSRWSKEKAGRDDGMLGAHWRKNSGDGGSDPRHRRRYAVAIENVEGGPGIVARYLLKRLNRELAKTRQQIREHGDQAKVWTGRTWGRFRGHVLEQFYEPPVTVETREAGRRLEALNEIARQVFGFKLGEIYAKDVGSRWVPVKRDDPDAQLFTPQRTRWLGHLGEYLRTGERRFLYAFGESRKVAKEIDGLIDVRIDAMPNAFGLSTQPAPSKPRDFESKTLFGGRMAQARPAQQRPPPGPVYCTECGEPQKRLGPKSARQECGAAPRGAAVAVWAGCFPVSPGAGPFGAGACRGAA